MELIKASAGGGNSHLTSALMLAAAFFFFVAAAHSPKSMTTTHPVQEVSVLKLPTEAISTAFEEEELCCNNCGICTKSFPPLCKCMDVLKECPSWCNLCQKVAGGERCLDLKANYCKNSCKKRRQPCCNNCGACTKSLPPICSCRDVLKECPSWCKECQIVYGGKMCVDRKINYCEKTCPSY